MITPVMNDRYSVCNYNLCVKNCNLILGTLVSTFEKNMNSFLCLYDVMRTKIQQLRFKYICILCQNFFVAELLILFSMQLSLGYSHHKGCLFGVNASFIIFWFIFTTWDRLELLLKL